MSSIEDAAIGSREFVTESFTLLGFAIIATGLRTYVRVKKGGWVKGLQVDDYFVWIGIVSFTKIKKRPWLQVNYCVYQILYIGFAVLAYMVGGVSRGLANNGISDTQRAALDINGLEFHLRVMGSQIHFSSWFLYCTLIWCLKMSVCAFFLRLDVRLALANTQIVGQDS
jgi:hypothetical protein